jgi:hypothetical protein
MVPRGDIGGTKTARNLPAIPFRQFPYPHPYPQVEIWRQFDSIYLNESSFAARSRPNDLCANDQNAVKPNEQNWNAKSDTRTRVLCLHPAKGKDTQQRE